MKKASFVPVLAALFLLAMTAPTMAAWNDNSWANRVQFNLTGVTVDGLALVNVTPYLNYCRSMNCSDFRVTVGETNNVTYQLITNGSTLGQLVSKYANMTGTSWINFIVRNTSADYYLYMNATGAPDLSVFTLYWEDDYESYNQGATPSPPPKGSFGNSVVFATAMTVQTVMPGNKGLLDNVSANYGYRYGLSFNSSVNLTVVQSFNHSSAGGAFEIRSDLTRTKGFQAPLYQFPCNSNNQENYTCIRLVGGTNLTQSFEANFTLNQPYMVTSITNNSYQFGVINSSEVRVFLGTTLTGDANIVQGVSQSTGDQLHLLTDGFTGGRVGVMSIQIYNDTVLPGNLPAFAFGSVQSNSTAPPSVVFTSPVAGSTTRATVPTSVSLATTISSTNPLTLCTWSLDGGAPTSYNCVSTSVSVPTQAAHNITVYAQSTSANSTSTVLFTIAAPAQVSGITASLLQLFSFFVALAGLLIALKIALSRNGDIKTAFMIGVLSIIFAGLIFAMAASVT